MPTVQEFAETFPNEMVLQQALAKLLSKIHGHTGVQILQGSAELGKDIIFYTPGAFGQRDLNACVVKNTKITGNAGTTAGARTVFNQAQQALDTPLLDENGREQKVRRVFIITPHPIPPETVSSIAGALRASDERVQFVSGASLLELFKQHWPGYLAEEFALMQSYADTLAETTASSIELRGLSFQYQLGAVDTSIKRVYVQPHLHRFVTSYSLEPLRKGLLLTLSDAESYSEEMIEGVRMRLRAVIAFLGTIKDWSLCSDSARRDASNACNALIDELNKGLSLAFAGRAARTKAQVQTRTMRMRLSNTQKVNQLALAATTSINKALADMDRYLNLAHAYMLQQQTTSVANFSLAHESVVNRLGEIARIAGPGSLVEVDERSCSFTGAMALNDLGHLFIVAPAGFGKTSFCRWNALNDLEKLLEGESSTLPVYVPLHQATDTEGKDFKEAFLMHAGVSALIPRSGKAQYERTRVYLDGLDEVPSEDIQKHIAEIAQAAAKSDPTLQMIITARDYVYGPWMTWLPRIHLSGFNETQIKEFVEKWLDGNSWKIHLFSAQLDKSSSLKEMMTIPLLAALIVLVFKQTDKLPENKTRLYEIFVDLHNGGWDLVKSIQRPSRFSATEKMFVLKRIAMNIHKGKRREMLELSVAEVAKDALKELDWKVLRDELLRDGLLIQMGSMISFAHHSFQEFLTARYLLGDPNIPFLNSCCDEYLCGSDWWQEVLCFYIDLVGKPREMRDWIQSRAGAARHSERRTASTARAAFLQKHLEESFPFAKS
jgi:hypothetical protein